MTCFAVKLTTVIPYFEIPSLELLGPFKLHPFGLLVGTGIVAGFQLSQKRALEKGLSREEFTTAFWWVIILGFLMAHWFEILFYRPEDLEREGLIVLLKIWDGISSYGGFFGALIGCIIYSRKYRVSLAHVCDIFGQGIVLGWVFGRLGCTIVHDHPGSLSQFFLAVDYPSGARHNLGLYEWLYTVVVMLPAILWFYQRKPRPGAMIAFVCALYAPVRFGLDFLRATDKANSDLRYWGLTPAQYSSMALVVVAVVLWKWVRMQPRQGVPLRKK